MTVRQGAANGGGTQTAPWLGLDTRESRRLVENVARDRRRVHDKGGARQAVYGHRRPWGDNSEKSFDSLVASVLFEMDRTAFVACGLTLAGVAKWWTSPFCARVSASLRAHSRPS